MLFQVARAPALILRMGRRLLLASGLLLHYCHHCRGVQGVLVFTVRLQRNYKGSIGKGRRWGYKEKVLESRLLPRSSSTSPINQTELGGPNLIPFNAISNVLDAETVLVSVNVLATELIQFQSFPFLQAPSPFFSSLVPLNPLSYCWLVRDLKMERGAGCPEWDFTIYIISCQFDTTELYWPINLIYPHLTQSVASEIVSKAPKCIWLFYNSLALGWMRQMVPTWTDSAWFQSTINGNPKCFGVEGAWSNQGAGAVNHRTTFHPPFNGRPVAHYYFLLPWINHQDRHLQCHQQHQRH